MEDKHKGIQHKRETTLKLGRSKNMEVNENEMVKEINAKEVKTKS